MATDEENIETLEGIKDYQKPLEIQLVEEKQSKPVDEDKSVISDKTLIALEENESLQKIVISKNEQVEELQSMLEMKEERMKELESQIEDKKKILLEGQYNFKWRIGHSTVVIRDRLYCWGGEPEDLPMVHDSVNKRQFTESIDILDIPTFKWEQKGTPYPPAGVRKYACANIGSSIFYYGGNCKPHDCFHDNLFELNTLTHNWSWKEIISRSDDNRPMKKIACGMMSFKSNGQDNLLLLGGLGVTPAIKCTQTDSKYTQSPKLHALSYTNETHVMSVSSSPGEWKSPIITGDRPPMAIAYFSINSLPENKGIMFGGLTINETRVFKRVNDLFLLSFPQDVVHFEKVVKQSLDWPAERSAHSSTVITTVSSNEHVTSHFVVLGGLGDDSQLRNDCWIMNLSSSKWYQINVPDSVTKRFNHSISTYYKSKYCVWITVTGGYKESTSHGGIPITGSNINVIMELVYSNDKFDEWLLNRIWDSEQNWYKTTEVIIREKEAERWSIKMQEKDQKLTLLQLNESSLTVERLNKQLEESQKLLEIQKTETLEKRIFEKEPELIKLSVEMRQKCDEITHLKTREVSLIDKSDTLKKELEFSKDETQAYKKMAITTRQELKIERKMSLIKVQELDFSRNQLQHFSEKLKLTSTLSPDGEDTETMEVNRDYQKTQERESLEEEKSKPVDDDKSVISDKTLIALEENESLQMIVASKNEQVEELHSILESQLTGKSKILHDKLESLQTTVVNKTTQMETKLKSLNLQMEEFKKIEELRNSSSHDSEVIKYQRDAAVQFSYMIPVTDHLDGVHVAGETLFLIQGDKPQSLNWEEYGFRLHFPQGAISPSDTCEVVIKALVGGKFQFPEGTELVSAVYAVAFAKKLLKAVEMEIQHCVNLTNEEQGKYLSFVSTAKTHRHHPNKFEFVEGGVFNPGKRYASIQRIHYCKNGIVKKTDASSQTTPPDSSLDDEDTEDNPKAKDTCSSVSSDSYTGQVYYERIGYNRWQMKFIVIRDIDAYMMYMSSENLKAERDEMITFSFLDPVDGFIELTMDAPQKYSNEGWMIIPHKEPFRISKNDVDLFGSQERLIHPFGLVTLLAQSTSGTDIALRYSVPIEGVKCNTKLLCITRLLETTDINTRESTSHQSHDKDTSTISISHTGTDRSTVDTKQVIRYIKQVIETHYSALSGLFEGLLKTVASEMLSVGLIPHAIEKNPTFDAIMSFFLAGFAFKAKLEDVEKYCVKFFSVFYELGGQFIDAADMIKQTIKDTIIDKLGVQLNI